VYASSQLVATNMFNLYLKTSSGYVSNQGCIHNKNLIVQITEIKLNLLYELADDYDVTGIIVAVEPTSGYQQMLITSGFQRVDSSVYSIQGYLLYGIHL
jgi:hypothetical protein